MDTLSISFNNNNNRLIKKTTSEDKFVNDYVKNNSKEILTELEKEFDNISKQIPLFKTNKFKIFMKENNIKNINDLKDIEFYEFVQNEKSNYLNNIKKFKEFSKEVHINLLKAYSNLINIDNLVSKHSNLGIK
jgi:ERCC4-related helicase